MPPTVSPESPTLTPSAPTIRLATTADAAPIAAIYNHFVLHTMVTFEEDPVTDAMIADRMREVEEAGLPWIVADLDGALAGYAYASKWKPRVGYRFSTEVTVYLAPGLGGRGVGSTLYAALLPMLRERGIRNAIGGIGLPNEASVRLHERFGFKKVAEFENVGIKFGTWMNVGYWQLELNTP